MLFIDVENIAGEIITQGEALGTSARARNYAGNMRWAFILLGRTSEVLERLTVRAGIVRGGAVNLILLAAAGETDRAKLGLHQTLERLARGDEVTLNEGVALLATAIDLDDPKAAAQLAPYLTDAESMITGAASPISCSVARLLGDGAALLGKPEQARAYYHKAIEVCERIRFRPELALTRLQLAELLLENYPTERAEAQEHLDFAIGEFREMKMQPSLERALRHKEFLKA